MKVSHQFINGPQTNMKSSKQILLASFLTFLAFVSHVDAKRPLYYDCESLYDRSDYVSSDAWKQPPCNVKDIVWLPYRRSYVEVSLNEAKSQRTYYRFYFSERETYDDARSFCNSIANLYGTIGHLLYTPFLSNSLQFLDDFGAKLRHYSSDGPHRARSEFFIEKGQLLWTGVMLELSRDGRLYWPDHSATKIRKSVYEIDGWRDYLCDEGVESHRKTMHVMLKWLGGEKRNMCIHLSPYSETRRAIVCETTSRSVSS